MVYFAPDLESMNLPREGHFRHFWGLSYHDHECFIGPDAEPHIDIEIQGVYLSGTRKDLLAVSSRLNINEMLIALDCPGAKLIEDLDPEEVMDQHRFKPGDKYASSYLEVDRAFLNISHIRHDFAIFDVNKQGIGYVVMPIPMMGELMRRMDHFLYKHGAA